MVKPIVHYNDSDAVKITLMGCAFVTPIDHTSPLVSNTKWIVTSQVIKYDVVTGIFETQNTIYKPAKYAFAGIN